MEKTENKYFEYNVLIKSNVDIKGEISKGEGGKGAFIPSRGTSDCQDSGVCIGR